MITNKSLQKLGISKRLCHTWVGMKQRCNYKKHKDYHRYGGRGIKVYKDWENSLEIFAQYIGEPPHPSYVMDRIDNDKNYEPGNIHWVTQSENARNTSRNKIFLWKGKKRTLMEISEKTGINYITLWTRLFKNKMDLNTAISFKRKRIFATFYDKKMSLKEISKKTGIPYLRLWYRFTVQRKQDLTPSQ